MICNQWAWLCANKTLFTKTYNWFRWIAEGDVAYQLRNIQSVLNGCLKLGLKLQTSGIIITCLLYHQRSGVFWDLHCKCQGDFKDSQASVLSSGAKTTSSGQLHPTGYVHAKLAWEQITLWHSVKQDSRFLETEDQGESYQLNQYPSRIFQACVYLNFSFRVDKKPHCVNDNKDLCYRTGNSAQCSVMAYMGKESRQEWIYVYV